MNEPIIILRKERSLGPTLPIQKSVVGVRHENGTEERFDEPMYVIDFLIKYRINE